MDNSNNYPQAEPVFTEVESSNIAAIAYTAGDPAGDLGALYIRFKSGGEYLYSNFPNQLALDFFECESHGKFFHANIKNTFFGIKRAAEDVKDEGSDNAEEPAEQIATDDGMAGPAEETEVPPELLYGPAKEGVNGPGGVEF